MKQPFINLDLRQPVNQWLCFALIALMAFLVVLYYLVNKAEAFGNDYVNATLSIEPATHRVLKPSSEPTATP